MPTEEELLIEFTHKGPGTTTAQRVYGTLLGDRNVPRDFSLREITASQTHSWLHRVSTLLAHVVERMEKEGTITGADIDKFLLDVAGK